MHSHRGKSLLIHKVPPPTLFSSPLFLLKLTPWRLASHCAWQPSLCVWWKWWRQQRWWRWWWWCVRACGMCVTVHVTERGVCLCGCWRLLHCACWGIEGLGSAQLCSSLALSLPLAVWVSRPLCLWWNYRTVGVVGPALFQALVSVFVLNRIWKKKRKTDTGCSAWKVEVGGGWRCELGWRVQRGYIRNIIWKTERTPCWHPTGAATIEQQNVNFPLHVCD